MVGSQFQVSVKAVEHHKRLHDKLAPGSHAPRRTGMGAARPDAPPRPSPEPLAHGARLVDQVRVSLDFNRARLHWEAEWGESKDLARTAASAP